MEEFVSFGSRTYSLVFLLLLLARGMDVLSTWVATPNMILEGNPVAKKLGWTWGIPINIVVCFAFACWPLPAIVISTTSLLVAARNFQSAWLMRSLGEEAYRAWHVSRVQETGATLYLFCLFGQTTLIAGVGAAIVFFSQHELVLLAIGWGIIFYALAVLFFTLLALWRLRRATLRKAWLAQRRLSVVPPAQSERNGTLVAVCVRDDAQPQGK
jgi:hypothetical protein